MSTLKAFKAAIQPGVQLAVSEHWMDRHRGTVRTVGKVQSNGFWFTQGDDGKRYWSEFPKASQLEFDGITAKIAIDQKFWTLRLPSAAVAA